MGLFPRGGSVVRTWR